MTNSLDEYRAALERIIARRPNVVPKDSIITNDAVSLEAGRVKGSIKKSRPVFRELIDEIKLAASVQAEAKSRKSSPIKSGRNELEKSLAREASLLAQIHDLKKQLSRLTGERVVPIRKVGKETS